MKDFYDEVLAQVRHATPEERDAIRAELEGHVEDHAEALKTAGWPEEEAVERAVESMGDPRQIGRELNSRYPLVWLVLSRLAAVGIALVCLSLLLSMPLHRIYHLSGNLTARLAPERGRFASQSELDGKAVQELDLRAKVGNDVLRVYAVVVDPVSCLAEVYLCNYDQNPFGLASGMLLDRVEITTPSGERSMGGGGGGNAGAYFRRMGSIRIKPGETELHLRYDRFGETVSMELPLDWGETA